MPSSVVADFQSALTLLTDVAPKLVPLGAELQGLAATLLSAPPETAPLAQSTAPLVLAAAQSLLAVGTLLTAKLSSLGAASAR